MPCCVPGCHSPLPGWETEMPRDPELRARWRSVIEVGTGQRLAEGSTPVGARICSMHFEMQQHHELDEEGPYREPTVFVRDNVLIQVVCCRLCLRCDTVDNMHDKNDCLIQNYSLQWMTNRYFGLLQSSKERSEKGYFCERCVVRIDMTHVFWEEINDGSVEYNRLLQKMASEKVMLKNAGLVMIHDMPMAIVQTPTKTQMASDAFKSKQNVPKIDESGFNAENNTQEVEQRSRTPHDLGVKEEPFENELDHLLLAPVVEKCMLVKPNNLPTHKCYLCNTMHDNNRTLIKHLLTGHDAQGTYHCAECNITYGKVKSFNCHLKKHEKPFKCGYCPVRFSWKCAKQKHEFVRHGETRKNIVKSKHKRIYKCFICNSVLDCNQTLVHHFLNHHSDLRSYHCQVCDEFFENISLFNNHLSTHEKPFKCNYCTVRFLWKSAKNKHETVKHGIDHAKLKEVSKIPPSPVDGSERPAKRRLFQCYICNTIQDSYKTLIHHLLIDHKNLESLDCAECNESFSKITTYNNHLWKHQKPFKCEHCPVRFSWKSAQKAHEAAQHGIDHGKRKKHDQAEHRDKDAECDICNKSFASSRYLADHIINHHRNILRDDITDGMVYQSSSKDLFEPRRVL